MPFSFKGWNQMNRCWISYNNDVIFKSSKVNSQFIYLVNIIISRIAKKLNYKRPFLKIALPSMFFLADQMMDVYYHQLLMSDVVALILFFSFCIIFLYGCFNTIQLRRMVSRFCFYSIWRIKIQFARRYPQKNPVGQPIEESYTTSCLLTFFCPCCSTAQMGSTLDAIEYDNIV